MLAIFKYHNNIFFNGSILLLPYFGKKRKLIVVGGVVCSNKDVCLLKVPELSLFETGLHLGHVMDLPINEQQIWLNIYKAV